MPFALSALISFSVVAPESIAGIEGVINSEGGGLKFDDKIIAFPLVIEQTISPISAPWILLKSLRSGYISACGSSDDGTQVIIDDSFSGQNIQCYLWLNDDDLPFYSEIVWNDRRVLSIDVEEMVFS